MFLYAKTKAALFDCQKALEKERAVTCRECGNPRVEELEVELAAERKAHEETKGIKSRLYNRLVSVQSPGARSGAEAQRARAQGTE